MLTNFYLLTKVPNETSGLMLGLEQLLVQMVVLLEVFLEIIAILIIASAVVIALQRLLFFLSRGKPSPPWTWIRLKFALSLALSLEFLLAADIVATAVSPSWDAIGKLAAITGIRTWLNFFLEKEVQQLEAKTQATQSTLEGEPQIGSLRPTGASLNR